MKDNSVRVYCLRFKGVESLCPPSQTFKWCEGRWGGLSRKERSKFRSFDCQTAVLTLGLYHVYGESVVALMFLFSMVSYLSISTITLWLVYYLKQHFTKWQVFVRFSFNFNLIHRFNGNFWNFPMVSSYAVWIL